MKYCQFQTCSYKHSKIVNGIIRGLRGMPIGITISTIISLIISVIVNDGIYYPISPALASAYSSPLMGVIVQCFVSAGIGFVFAAVELIWEHDTWSLLLQTAFDFFIRISTLAVAGGICYWYPHRYSNFIQWLLIAIFVYGIIWLIKWIHCRRRISEINTYLAAGNRTPPEKVQKR